MIDALAAALLLASVPVAVFAWLGAPALAWRWRTRRATARPFPPVWRAVLRRRMPLYRRLPPPLQRQLQRHVQVLLAEVPFIGCDGQVVTDEVRVLIAAQAALLLLGRPQGRFQGLREVLVYPAPFVVGRSHTDAAGVVHEGRRTLLGESWQRGQVVLSWPDVVHGAAVPDDGHNVVLHEFAHQLDQETGPANGAPVLGRRDGYARWTAVWRAAYARLGAAHARGEPGALDAYAATDPAEFFAVACEAYFERPAALREAEPALYDELRRWFGVDPLAWH